MEIEVEIENPKPKRKRKRNPYEPRPYEGEIRERIFNFTRFGLTAEEVDQKLRRPAPRVRDTIMALVDEGRLVLDGNYRWQCPEDIERAEIRRRKAERKHGASFRQWWARFTKGREL